LNLVGEFWGLSLKEDSAMASGQAPTEDVKGVVGGEQGTPPPPKKLRDRLYFADNLRTWLITLVVLHHLAIVYTGVGAFY